MKKLSRIIPSVICIIALILSDKTVAYAANEAQTAAKTVNISLEEDDTDDKTDDTESSEEKEQGIGLENAGDDGASEKSDNYAIERPDPSEMTEVRIGSYEDWCDLAHNCTLDTWSADKYVVMTDNIDFNMKEFVPIPYFAGIFDGDNHTINKAAFTGDQNYIGVFSRTAPQAVIRNVNVIGVMKPTGKPFDIGGIAGDNAGMIANCKYDGYVEGYDYIGGIAGYNEATGIVSACTVTGKITGLHYVGGICGASAGLVTGCSAKADINTVTKEVETGLADIKVEEVFTSLLNRGREEGNKKMIANSTNPVDIGGIAGHNTGEISSCANDSAVGYEHVGYNIGGIAGRSSGYVHDCINNGKLQGRKDVGGIVGQAEPYIRLDLTKDIISQLNTAINSLHDSVDKTIRDTDSSSGVVSARLNVIKSFADRALSDTGYLANSTTDFVNGVTGATNEIVGRLEYVIDETSKNDGPMDKVKNAGSDFKDAAADVEKMAEDMDIYRYMTPAEKASYDEAKQTIKDKTAEYDAKRNYYETADAVAAERATKRTTAQNEAKDETLKGLYDEKKQPGDREWNTLTPEEKDAFYNSLTDDEKARVDSAADAAGTAAVKAWAAGRADTDTGYADTMAKKAAIIGGIVLEHSGEMSEGAKTDGKNAAADLKDMAENLRDSGSQMKSIIGNVAGRSDVRFPQLSEEYRMHTNSLVSNIRGMSDNLGFLNNEMKGSTDVVCNDLEDVNDGFSTIMLLFTDAMDGVLDMDYSEVYEDESNDVCETSVDATIADCTNFGNVFGDIDTGGIAGTMAEEYDFDLESDVTGVKDSARNSTYRTKCVARSDINRGEVKGKKSYAGGVCGLHEIGTILRCSNFAKASSQSGDYVGGVAGRSYATIRDSYEKGVLAGGSYIGGIAGSGAVVTGCIAMPSVTEGTNFTGAVVGSSSDGDRLKGNLFVSGSLAGIDRISKSGMAEPVAYSQLLAMDNVPADFSVLKVDFVVDGKKVATLDKRAGDVVTLSEVPVDEAVSKAQNAESEDDNTLSLEDDEYIKWDCDDEITVTEDTEINGSIVRYASSLASEQVRANKQSIFLVDGRFKKDDVLSVTAASMGETGYEEFVIVIPEDGESTHHIRYQEPADSEGVKVMLINDSQWEEVPTETYGRYVTFTAPGDEVRVRIEERQKRDMTMWFVIGGCIALVFVISLILVIRSKNRKKKTEHKKMITK